jgi:hypothetical protein
MTINRQMIDQIEGICAGKSNLQRAERPVNMCACFTGTQTTRTCRWRHGYETATCLQDIFKKNELGKSE